MADFGMSLDPVGMMSGIMNWQNQQSAMATNQMMNTGQWKAAQIQQEAKALGVSPLAILGGSNYSANPVSVGDVSMGQNAMRASMSTPEDDTQKRRIDDLTSRNLELRNQGLELDNQAAMYRNAKQAINLRQPGSPPPVVQPYQPHWSLDDMWQRLAGHDAPSRSTQAFYDKSGKIWHAPSPKVQQGLWSPVPGIPANPQATAEVIRMNSGDIPPDVARMSGLPPGSIDFVPGTAPSLWKRFYDWQAEGSMRGGD